MRNVLSACVIAAIAVMTIGRPRTFTQSPSTVDDRLLDLLLRGVNHVTVSDYTPEVQPELEDVVRRNNAYESRRRRPGTASDPTVIYATRVRYERLLISVTDDPAAPALAAKYTDALKPCYEWEGYHDCPEREATFATLYLKSNPSGPFSEYLPLLAAHRWLCTEEAYKYEKNPKDAARSLRAYGASLATARKSSSALMRAAADALSIRGTCFPRQQR